MFSLLQGGGLLVQSLLQGFGFCPKHPLFCPDPDFAPPSRATIPSQIIRAPRNDPSNNPCNSKNIDPAPPAGALAGTPATIRSVEKHGFAAWRSLATSPAQEDPLLVLLERSATYSVLLNSAF